VSGRDLGVYVHIPFCARRCDYCAFVTYTEAEHLERRYVDAVLAEMATSQGVRPATSAFFGGGTPSHLDVGLLVELVSALDLAPGAEVTVEMNPEDVTAPRLAAMVDAGVTRVSIGIQSTADHVLVSLGRTHRGDAVRRLCETVAASGLTTWSMDLIAGAASETDEDLRRSIADILDHDAAPPHLSAYLLTVERGTPLSRDESRHPDEDVLAGRYEILDAELAVRGYDWYEVSNWAKPGHECRHNRLYWEGGDYLGFGAAAHGHRGGERSWNLASLTAYLEAIEAGRSPRAGSEMLTEGQRDLERLSLALRTRHGVPLPTGGVPEDLAGFLEEHDDRLVLTLRGRLLADAVLGWLLTSSEDGRAAR
jgi:oxygen-independent coproporphyrinogen-3 oxidase